MMRMQLVWQGASLEIDPGVAQEANKDKPFANDGW